PAGPPAGGGGPAKTMFGYAAPVVRPPMPAQPQPPTTGVPQPRPQQPGFPQAQPPQQQPQGYPSAPQQPGYPPAPQQPAGYPPPGGNPFAAPQQDLPGPLDNMARHIPQSAPGTLFGLPLSKLREDAFQKKFLFLAGFALLASIFVPYHLSPTQF